MTTSQRSISLQRAAEELDMSVKTVRRYIAAGRLKAYRVGPRVIRVDAASLEELRRPIGTAW